MTLYTILFLAGLLTILLPCILPLVPIVVGVSIAGQHRLRPLATVAGMVVSFVFFTFLLLVVLRQFVETADYIRIGTYAILLLFGTAFFSESRTLRSIGAIASGFFFWDKGPVAVFIAILAALLLMEAGGRVASRLQNIGAGIQLKARTEFGSESLLTAFIIGLTLGLVWVPCAGPALGFALTLVRDEPGARAAAALVAYASGTAVPLLLVGYGGQYAVRSVRSLASVAGRIKQVAGILLILTAIALHFQAFQRFQIWLLDNTNFGDLGTRLEERLIGDDPFGLSASSSSVSSDAMNLPTLPKIIRAPEFTGLGPWHNSEPFTLASLKGKVVLVDFWTYSCINCIRTLSTIQGYWEAYKDTGAFTLLGVHTPEFTFEKSEKNVADAIRNHGLTYPVAQDNDFGTWRAFANRYWPAKYLIDADGYIRYTHFGEGAYEETDAAIRSLLLEAGVAPDDQGFVSSEDEKTRRTGPVTPEIYLGTRSWPALGNAQGEPTDASVTYSALPTVAMHTYQLVGTWKLVDGELQELVSDEGEIRMRFTGGEINLVLGLAEGVESAEVDVTVDGKFVKTLSVGMHDLYPLFTGAYGEHEIILSVKGQGVQAFAFTFGR